MTATRHLRVEKAVMAEVADILKELKDPGLGFASVLRVELSSDYSVAKVHMSCLGGDDEQRRTEHALKRAKGHIRSELGRRIRLRHTPELVFLFRGELEHAQHIHDLLDKLKEGDHPADHH